ncbi:unnamed protein product, partial [Amoebophrya sp. A120]
LFFGGNKCAPSYWARRLEKHRGQAQDVGRRRQLFPLLRFGQFLPALWWGRLRSAGASSARPLILDRQGGRKQAQGPPALRNRCAPRVFHARAYLWDLDGRSAATDGRGLFRVDVAPQIDEGPAGAGREGFWLWAF